MSTKVRLGKSRLSYPVLFEPTAMDDNSKAKYSAVFLVPKSDTETMAKIKAAQKEAENDYRRKKGQNSLPPKPVTTIHDGDGTREDGSAYGPECKGCWIIRASSTRKPLVLDKYKNVITDESEIYGGCYCYAVLDFYAYNFNGKKGITASLVSVMKIADGEPFGGAARATADDYDDFNPDDDDYNDLL